MPMEPLRIGDPLGAGGYGFVCRLGRGDRGMVFLGRSADGQAVAARLIDTDFAGDDEVRARFATEARAAMSVDSRHIAPVVAASADGDLPWLVSLYIPGPSLSRAVTGHGPLPADTVRTLGAHLAEGLAALHDHGLVHRDLRPGNILLADDGPRITGFGIWPAVEAVALVRDGAGAPVSASPEQIRGDRDLDWRTDVFALGCALAFAATGTWPFGTGRPEAVADRICHQAPDLDTLPPLLREVVAACLAESPADRPTTQEILRRLEPPDLPAGSSWLPGDLAAQIPRRPASVRLFSTAPLLARGRLAKEQGDLTTAGRYLEQVAAGDDPGSAAEAMHDLGWVAWEGHDRAEAHRRWERAAAAGAPAAMDSLAVYAWQKGDRAKAREYLERLAAGGHAGSAISAMHHLMLFARLRDELGPVRRWWEDLAAGGDAEAAPVAMLGLGWLLHAESDPAGARRWWERAAGHDDAQAAPLAMNDLGWLARSEGDPAGARHWYERAAASGHPDAAPKAMHELGRLALKDDDLAGARHWWEQAAANGHIKAAPPAMRDLGWLAWREGNPAEARRWWEQAVATHHPEAAPSAMHGLGWLARRDGDRAGARLWWEQTAATSEIDAASRARHDLGWLAEEEGDMAKARIWWELAAGSGHAEIAPPSEMALRFFA